MKARRMPTYQALAAAFPRQGPPAAAEPPADATTTHYHALPRTAPAPPPLTAADRRRLGGDYAGVVGVLCLGEWVAMPEILAGARVSRGVAVAMIAAMRRDGWTVDGRARRGGVGVREREYRARRTSTPPCTFSPSDQDYGTYRP